MERTALPLDFGIRFCPTDEELIHHLKNKLFRLTPLKLCRWIVERNLYGEKATPWTLFADEDPWQTPVDMLGTVHCNERVIYVYTKLSNVGKTGNKNKIRTAGCGEWHGNATEAVKKNGETIGRKRTFTFKSKEETTTVGQWTMYEYGLEVESGGNDYDVVVCKIKVDYSKSSKGGRLVSRRSHINSTKYLSMESTSSLDHVDLDDGSVNSLGRKRPQTQSVFYDQESGKNDNKKKARSSGAVSYFQDLLSEDTDQRREEIMVENINKMLANIHEEQKDHHGTNSSVNCPMGAMIDQAASKDDDSSAISSRFNNIHADADVDAAALIGDNCSNPINLDDFEEVDHHHNCHTAALIGYYDNVPSSSNDVLTIEDYPVDDVRFTMDALLGDDQPQPVNNVVNGEEQKIFDDESSQHCPTTTLHEDEEANSNATTTVSDAIAAAPQVKDDDDYIDHNPLLNPNLLLEDDIESILKLFPDVENVGEEFYSNPNAFFEMDT